jgi:hypothetical protein
MARKGNRTRKGNVTAAARKRSGGGKGLKKGSFPVFDKKSARSALRLRGHAKNRSAVLRKVSRYASKTGDTGLKSAVKKARKADKRRS